MDKIPPLVSVIVTTKNEEKNIGRCLESIKQQTYSRNKIEIIVVDNNSSDRIIEIASDYVRPIKDIKNLLQYNHASQRAFLQNIR